MLIRERRNVHDGRISGPCFARSSGLVILAHFGYAASQLSSYCGFQLQGQYLVSWKHDDQRRVILSLMSPEITGFCGLRPQPKRVERGHIAG